MPRSYKSISLHFKFSGLKKSKIPFFSKLNLTNLYLFVYSALINGCLYFREVLGSIPFRPPSVFHAPQLQIICFYTASYYVRK